MPINQTKIKWGLIGYGKVADLHAKAIIESKNGELCAVWGRNSLKREAFAAKYAIASCESIAEMAEKYQVNAVLIVTPHPSHKALAIEAFAAGCHVLVEKPMALKVEDCDAMIFSAKTAQKTLGVISQRRFYPSSMRIKNAIDKGDLGAPMLAQVTMLGWRDQNYYNSDPWRGTWKTEGGGVLVNQAPHQLDLLCWYMGEIAEIKGFWGNINHPYIEVEDSAIACVRFKSGGLASILVSNSQQPGIYAKVHIHGQNGASIGVQTDGGAMFIAGMSGIAEPPYNDICTIPNEEKNLTKWKEEDEAFFAKIDATTYFFKLQIEDFNEAIHKGKTPLVTGEDGRKTVQLFEGIYASDAQ